MAKIEVELNDEQLEKLKQLEKNGISAGDAIDKLFEMKEMALPEIAEIDEEQLGLFEKVKGNTLDVENKAEILEENYGDDDKSYEMKIQEVKHKISWAKDFFNY